MIFIVSFKKQQLSKSPTYGPRQQMKALPIFLNIIFKHICKKTTMTYI